MASRLLSVKEVASAKPRNKEYLLADGDGLFLRIRAEGGKAWLFVYSKNGKRPKHVIGDASVLSLAEARELAAEARRRVADGIDPTAHRDAAKIQAQAEIQAVIATAQLRKDEDLTLEEMFEKWLSDGVARADENYELKRSFGKDVLSTLGSIPIKELTEDHFRKILRGIIARGKHRYADMLHGDLGQMFRWAQKRKPWRSLLTDGSPIELIDLANLLPHDYDTTGRERVLTADEVVELRDKLKDEQESYEARTNKRSGPQPVSAKVQCALWIALSTLCRVGELSKARWEHVDLQRAVWFIPKSNVKGARGKRRDLTVQLSPFALRQFQTLHELTREHEHCFPGRVKAVDGDFVETHIGEDAMGKQIGDRQGRFMNRSKTLGRRRMDDTLVLAGGVNGEWSFHDLRRTGATWMQALGILPDIIDRCQNHQIGGSKVRKVYQRYDYADEMREAWSKLGGRLEDLLA